MREKKLLIKETVVFLIIFKFFCCFIMVHQGSQPPAPQTYSLGNSKFEILLVKIFSLKQKHQTSNYYRKKQILCL